MKYEMGEEVSWSSQSGGVTKTKLGKIVAVVPPRHHPRRYIEKVQKDYGGSPNYGGGGPRNHESYIVIVPSDDSPFWNREKRKIYWPQVKRLFCVRRRLREV